MATSPFLSSPVYRICTAVLVHGGLLHLVFNMLAFVPIASGVERDVGTLQVRDPVAPSLGRAVSRRARAAFHHSNPAGYAFVTRRAV